jgi:IclR family pca regulon transcriptional regulator
MQSNARDDNEFVEALARGLAVLESFDANCPEMTLSEVAEKTRCSPAAARRSLITLVALGYVRKTGRLFVLTPKVLLLGAAYFRTAHVEDALLPELRKFVDIFGDAASVGVMTGRDVLYVAHQSAGSGLRPVAGTGVTYPAHATSLGRVLLAAGSDEQLEDYVSQPLKSMTDLTVVDPSQFKALIKEVRAIGYATSVDQLAYGVTAIAVPIILPSGQTVAAVNSSGYTGRLTPERLVEDRLGPLRELAQRLAQTFAKYPALLHSLAQ